MRDARKTIPSKKNYKNDRLMSRTFSKDYLKNILDEFI